LVENQIKAVARKAPNQTIRDSIDKARAYPNHARLSAVDFSGPVGVQTRRPLRTNRNISAKRAVELTFSFNKAQWASAAHTVVAADWIVEFHDHDSGREVIAVDRSSRIGLLFIRTFEMKKVRPTW
jgi:hypothetical protein